MHSKLANTRDGSDPYASNTHHLHAPPEMRVEGKEHILISIGCALTAVPSAAARSATPSQHGR